MKINHHKLLILVKKIWKEELNNPNSYWYKNKDIAKEIKHINPRAKTIQNILTIIKKDIMTHGFCSKSQKELAEQCKIWQNAVFKTLKTNTKFIGLNFVKISADVIKKGERGFKSLPIPISLAKFQQLAIKKGIVWSLPFSKNLQNTYNDKKTEQLNNIITHNYFKLEKKPKFIKYTLKTNDEIIISNEEWEQKRIKKFDNFITDLENNLKTSSFYKKEKIKTENEMNDKEWENRDRTLDANRQFMKAEHGRKTKLKE